MKLNKVLSAFLFAVLADFVLWNEGINYGYGFLLAFLYLAAIALIVLNNRFVFRSKVGKIALAASGITFFALLENISALSFGLACFNLIVLSFIRCKDLDAGKLVGKVFKTIGAMLSFPYFRIVKIHGISSGKLSILKKAVLPILFSILFMALFSFINPLFRTIIECLWNFIVEWINPLRIAFFLLMTSVGFVLVRNRVRSVGSIFDAKVALRGSEEFLSYKSICISLVIFNAIFYAHVVTELYSIFFSQGASAVASIASQAIDAAHVLLIVTLLAIVFISLASSYDKQTEKLSLMRFLVIVWLFQNFILMVLGINYLDMFIKAEGLTYWRFSSVIWYGLIALGLILTTIKIRYRKSLSWLVNWNAFNVYLTFTVLCFVNISAYIAQYNSDHLRRYPLFINHDYKSNICPGRLCVFNEDALPVNLKVNYEGWRKEWKCCPDREAELFMRKYNSSYRFWTFRRYRTAKAIANYEITTKAYPKETGKQVMDDNLRMSRDYYGHNVSQASTSIIPTKVKRLP